MSKAKSDLASKSQKYRALFFEGKSPEALTAQEMFKDLIKLRNDYHNKAAKEFDKDKSYAYSKIAEGVSKVVQKIELTAKTKDKIVL